MLISLVVAYVIGAIPTGYWLCKWLKGVDVRQQGSGNIGATNSARLLGKKYFGMVFLLDSAKAWMALFLCDRFLLGINETVDRGVGLLVVAGALLIGNAYSCFIAFRGGKGVATVVGVVGYLYPPFIGILFCCSWLIMVLITRCAFVASLVSVVLMCVVGPLVYKLETKKILFLIFVALWLIVRHHGNIKKWWVGGDS